MKKVLKKLSLRTFAKCLEYESTRSIINKLIRNGKADLPQIDNLPNPYSLKSNNIQDSTRLRSDIVFVTGRFRSGSTVVWNLFRQIEKCTSYYEPFNERRWFSNETRGEKIDKTHVGVEDYWNEYDGLHSLSRLYDENWIRHDLYMNSDSWNLNMLKYIEQLIEAADGAAVLQFNRIDFRLDWIKYNFPNAKIVHLFRHPRDQWCSFLIDKKVMNRNDVEFTYKDAFYLNAWCRDLKTFFPFLDEQETPHPYRRFYFLWKLSYLFGKKSADYSFSYESLVSSPEKELDKLFSALNWEVDSNKYTDIFQPPVLDKWKPYADEEWFSRHEHYCEAILQKFFQNKAQNVSI
jgi:hypothetical protein